MSIPSYDQVVLDSVPTAYWKLDELTAATVAVNSSINGTGYNGTYIVATDGIINKEQIGPFLYNSPNNSVQFVSTVDTQIANVTLPLIGSLAVPTMSFTIEGWFRSATNQVGHTNDPTFIVFPTSSIILVLNNAATPYILGATVNNASGAAQVFSGSVLLGDSWNYIVMDFDGQNLNLYLNNIILGTDATPAPGVPIASGSNPLIARAITTTISRVAWYTRVLTQAERELHYAASCR